MIDRFWKLLVTLAGALSLAVVVGAAPAYAGEAGKTCVTYYHLNDPALGGYTVCVKLEHDPTTHAWRTNASVTTTTPGMTLHTALVDLIAENNVVATGSKPPAASQQLGIVTSWWVCSGAHQLSGTERGFVTWPDGTDSAIITTETPLVTGTC